MAQYSRRCPSRQSSGRNCLAPSQIGQRRVGFRRQRGLGWEGSGLEESPFPAFPGFEIGRGTYGKPRVLTWPGERTILRIGAFCSIADDVHIFLGGNHRVDWATTFPFSVVWPEAAHIEGHPASRGNVLIGNDVWVGRSAMIMSGVSIGDGAVVTKDLPPYSIAVGNPARVVRMRFEEEIVQRFLAVRWWDWPDSVIAQHLPLLLNSDVGGFLDAAEGYPTSVADS